MAFVKSLFDSRIRLNPLRGMYSGPNLIRVQPSCLRRLRYLKYNKKFVSKHTRYETYRWTMEALLGGMLETVETIRLVDLP